jgi:potassium/sodium efflux P-type ATPase
MVMTNPAVDEIAMQMTDPALMIPEQLASHYGSDLTQGLTEAQAKTALERDGPNELKKVAKPTLLMLFLMQLTGFIIILLICAAAASVVVNATGPAREDILSYTTGKAIFVIVFINAGIAAWTEHKAGGALDALSKMSQAAIYIVRNGQEVKVDTTTIVRGDIVVLGTGDVVPADLRLIEAEDLKVSEMALTGEPDDVAKTSKMKQPRAGDVEKLTPENMVFSGCSVTNGKGRGLVVGTGMSTRLGKIAQLIADKDGAANKNKCFCLPDTSGSATPLQKNLDWLGHIIGLLAIGVCVLVFVIGVALQRSEDGTDSWLYMILISVTLAVAAIPEGIPLCVTISLSIGCTKMVNKSVLVRKLAAVETLGSASVICSDKTGTLTEGKMTMVNMWSGGVAYDVSGKGFDPTEGGIARAGSGENAAQDMGVCSTLHAALLCCNTTLSKVPDPDTGVEKWEPKGNSSEAPIIVAARKIGMDEGAMDEYKRILEVPFSSSRKMMLTVTEVSGKRNLCLGGAPLPAGSEFVVVCKGAPNYIVDLCTTYLSEDGSSAAMTDATRADVLRQVDEYSGQALRVLAIATRPLAALPFDLKDEEMTTDSKFALLRQELQLVGLVASIDPDRDGVKESVSQARGAGIRVVMITGDYLKTAAAIARNVRILQDGDDESISAVDCASLRPDGNYLGENEMDSMTNRVRVFARAKPEDKLEIVKSLQRQGCVTAMTGDGVNDAPALNQADIGVAMGLQGTDVAKGAADMILTDDNFCSIVSAVEMGRAIYAGIQKFVAFIMSVHIAEVLQIFICIAVGMPVMRTPVQILFLILVTDLPPSIALGMEPAEKGILKQRPRPKDEPVVLGWMWLNMVMNAFILSLVVIVVYVVALLHFLDNRVLIEEISFEKEGDEKALMCARTVAFISLVFCENVRSYTSRSFDKPVWKNICGNKAMHAAIIAAQVALYVAVLTPFLSDQILELDGFGIGWWGWGVAACGPVAALVLCELSKFVTAFQIQQHQRRLAKVEELVQESKTVAAAEVMDAPAKEKSGPLERVDSYNRLQQAAWGSV